jgi:hypothetical protein
MRVPLSFMLPRRTVAVQCSAVHVHYASRAGGGGGHSDSLLSGDHVRV